MLYHDTTLRYHLFVYCMAQKVPGYGTWEGSVTSLTHPCRRLLTTTVGDDSVVEYCMAAALVMAWRLTAFVEGWNLTGSASPGSQEEYYGAGQED
jgi:hypothetical protein